MDVPNNQDQDPVSLSTPGKNRASVDEVGPRIWRVLPGPRDKAHKAHAGVTRHDTGQYVKFGSRPRGYQESVQRPCVQRRRFHKSLEFSLSVPAKNELLVLNDGALKARDPVLLFFFPFPG